MHPILNPINLALMYMDENSIINPENLALTIPIVSSVAFFIFLSIYTWVHAKRREKEAFYKNETLRRIAESPDGGAAALEFLKEEQRLKDRKRREGRKIGGLVATATGLGLMIFLFALNRADHDPDPDYLIGLILMLIGAALLAYSYWLAPKDDQPHPSE